MAFITNCIVVVVVENVGLTLSYGLSLNSVLFWAIYMSCFIENKMVSVERIKQFSKIQAEAAWNIKDRSPPPNWPGQGHVDIKDLQVYLEEHNKTKLINLSSLSKVIAILTYIFGSYDYNFSDKQVRYRPNTPLVLKGITLSINGGEKVGVVGRTGSGKSTLIQVFFRLVEPTGGKIIIDGIDISALGLHDLRSRFGIIPQEPVLFEGTVRSNIDPTSQYTDEEIWKVNIS